MLGGWKCAVPNVYLTDTERMSRWLHRFRGWLPRGEPQVRDWNLHSVSRQVSAKIHLCWHWRRAHGTKMEAQPHGVC